jgi:hypothetical protein
VNLRKDHYRIVKSYIISILGSICLLDAVSALRNPVASKDLAESYLGVWFSTVAIVRPRILVGTKYQCSLSNEGPLRLGTYTWRLDGTCPARWSGTLR